MCWCLLSFHPPSFSSPTVPKRKGIAPVAKAKDAAEGSTAKDAAATAAAAPSKKPAGPKKDKEPKDKAPAAPKIPKASSSFMIFSNEMRPRVRGEGCDRRPGGTCADKVWLCLKPLQHTQQSCVN